MYCSATIRAVYASKIHLWSVVVQLYEQFTQVGTIAVYFRTTISAVHAGRNYF